MKINFCVYINYAKQSFPNAIQWLVHIASAPQTIILGGQCPPPPHHPYLMLNPPSISALVMDAQPSPSISALVMDAQPSPSIPALVMDAQPSLHICLSDGCSTLPPYLP